MLVRKHALGELQPLIATIAALYHMGEKLTMTITQVILTQKYELFSKWKSADRQFTRTSRDIRHISAASETWRTLLRLFAYEAGGQHA